MFKHLFTLVWNKKKQNFLLMFEMLISFLVIFAVFSLMLYYYNNYRSPMGMDYDDVWAVQFSENIDMKSGDSLNTYYDLIKHEVKALPLTRNVTYSSGNVPFANHTIQTGVSHNGRDLRGVNLHYVEPEYRDVLGLTLLEGRWFEKTDVSGRSRIVVNRALKEELFGNSPAVGKAIGSSENRMTIIGVVESMKIEGDYRSAGMQMFQQKDTTAGSTWGMMLVKVAPEANAAFEGRVYKTLAKSMKNANIEIEHLSVKRKNINYFALVPIVVTSIVAGFLVVNVALGLFGVLWYNINKRRTEIGLRRAVGASGNSVANQLIGESMVLATLAILIGTFFAVQFPLLQVFDLAAGIYLTAILLSILFIYLLVLLCSWYPGKQAAAVYPAIALHEE